MKYLATIILFLSSCVTYPILDPENARIECHKGDKATVVFQEKDGDAFGYADFYMPAKQDSITIIIRK